MIVQKIQFLDLLINDFRTVAAEGAEFTFISQSFFLCWRALHLGVVAQCNKYIQVWILEKGQHFFGIYNHRVCTYLDVKYFSND